MTATVLRTGLMVLAIVLVLSAACAQKPQDPPARQQVQKQSSGERSEILPSQPSRMATAEATAAAEDMAILAGGTPPPEYQVRGGGTLIIGGDVLVRCKEVGSWEAPRSATRAAERQIRESQREQVKVCTEAGFPPDRASR